MPTCYPITAPARSAAPTSEPITVAEAKRQLGIPESVGAHDIPLGDLLVFAREQTEKDSMLVCSSGAYTVKMTDFGSEDWFELPSSLRPVTAVGSITYVDTSGTTSTWSSSEYTLDTYTITPIVRLVYGYSWPTLRGDINGITITCTAGYTATNMPKRLKQAVTLRLQHEWHTRMGEQREAELAMRAYDSIVSQLRHEVYA